MRLMHFCFRVFRVWLWAVPLLCPMYGMAATTMDLGTALDIQGKVPDMQHQIESSGLSFRVELRDIGYRGKVNRTRIEVTDRNHLTVWVELEDAVLTVQRTEINGRRHRAKCGPLEMTLGNRRDLWIAFEVERKQDAAEEKLELVRTRFKLPHDNWSVGSPPWVTTSGLGMTESKVVNGLRRGLANRSQSVEKQLLRVAPDIFAQIDDEVLKDLRTKERAAGLSADSSEIALQVE